MLVHKLTKFYKSHFKLILFLLFVGLGILAWCNRFIQDDAFISFRYADNFVRGKGLVFNEGERVEGYTNFLWTIIVSIPLLLKLDPVKFVFGLGLILFELSLYFTYRVAAGLFRSQHLALLTVLLLGTNYTFSSYATGGLETQLQTCLLLAGMWMLIEIVWQDRWSPARLLLLSVLLSLAVLTRLDSSIMVFVVLSVMLFAIFRAKGSKTQKTARVVLVLTPLLLVVGAWLFWKLRFYGSVLPNSFYVKVASLNSLKRGLIYVCLFFYSYWLVLFPFLFLIFARRIWRCENRVWVVLAISIILWLSYVVFVGGDFMEFRFIVPVLPLVFLCIVWLALVQVRRSGLQLGLILLLLAGSLHHALTFTNPALRYYDVESTKGLSDLLYRDRTDWVGIGNVLGEVFNHDPNVTIGITAAGAIPFYSRLKTIDILGLNDQWVARHGEIVASKPGHQRRATINYLIERKVNLLIGHPQMVPIESDLRGAPLNDYYFYVKITKNDRLPANSKIIEIPINSAYKLRVLYLVETPLVDETIKKNGWLSYPFERELR